MQITIHNEGNIALDSDITEALFKRLLRDRDYISKADVYPQERVNKDAPAYKHPGHLEWILKLVYKNGSSITICMLQRHEGEAVEFHS